MVVPCCPLSQCIGRCPSSRASKEAFEFSRLFRALHCRVYFTTIGAVADVRRNNI
ncbi:hypothetical protein CABS01_13547 [Colletotrichum abscissum]|uniref:uncharacterized protein n=1 Tax=Colletotrichum abscissum TaxID=1671311 RepID=UPI0027D592ED|nr:uncharacterized protein CABS01_13547 [Colletotrichum abscissum]KAK1485252.1 hypothetical protein CABS01_13547 [Colletotrichum abscissum]